MIGGEAFGGGDAPAFLIQTRRKARKAHTCAECGLEIESGSVYVELEGLGDGGFYRARYCRSCDRWAAGAFATIGLELYPIGELSDAIAYLTEQADGSYAVERRPRL